MESISKQITELHAAFCAVTTQELPMNLVFERYWHEAIKLGVTVEDVRLCIKNRIGFNYRNGLKKSLSLSFLIGSEEGIGTLLSEAAEERAKLRIKVFPKGKRDVLEATGRDGNPPPSAPQHVGDVELVKALRKAAG